MYSVAGSSAEGFGGSLASAGSSERRAEKGDGAGVLGSSLLWGKTWITPGVDEWLDSP